MPGSIRLGKILGVPFHISYSWFPIFVLVTISLAFGQFPHNYPTWPVATHLVLGIATSLLFFASVVVHELAHSMVAMSIGIPVKSITLFIFGGVAQISREASRPTGELVMAIVGPVSSLALAALFGLLGLLSDPFFEPVAALAWWLAGINLSLALFNLVPGFPMDGGRVLRSILWWVTKNHSRATRIAVLIGQGVAYLFILGGILAVILNPKYLFSGLWIIFIGWFLERAAEASYRQEAVKDALHGYTAADLMMTDRSYVSPNMVLRALVDQYLVQNSQRWLLVVDDRRLKGIINVGNVRKIPKERWDTTFVEEAMTPVERLRKAMPGDDALNLLEWMEESGVEQIPVVDSGRLAGIISRDRLVSFIHTRSELKI